MWHLHFTITDALVNCYMLSSSNVSASTTPNCMIVLSSVGFESIAGRCPVVFFVGMLVVMS